MRCEWRRPARGRLAGFTRAALPDSTPAPAEWCPGPDAYDEIKTELLGLSYAEDLQLMAEFGSAVLAARNGTVLIEVT